MVLYASGTDTDVQLSEVLSFCSGADCIPPLDFDKRPTIEFYNQEQGQRRLPSSSTCSLILWLPRGILEPSEMADLMYQAINLSAGFGRV